MTNSNLHHFSISAGNAECLNVNAQDTTGCFVFQIQTDQRPNQSDDIGAYILNHDNFLIWQTNQHARKAGAREYELAAFDSITSVKINWGALHFQPPAPGLYYVVLDNAHSTFAAKRVTVEISWINYTQSTSETVGAGTETLEPNKLLEQILRRFPVMARQLQMRHDNRPSMNIVDEYDVQDLLHAVLRLFYMDVRAEEWTPSYAGGAARMDFLLKSERTVVEVKNTRQGVAAKQVGDQLLVDIARYSVHPDCQTLICLVHDPDARIGNPVGLENDLSRANGEMTVKVIVTPKVA